ncbi:MAG: hypothetical protein LBD28_04895, partial [Tannerellaceae bacterium]|nr:hypothetical protein [Tannerellaceae bacterium]
MSKDSDKLFAILGSVAFHLVIILMLAVSFLRANVYEYQDVEILPSSYASAGGSPAPSQGASGQQQPSANLPASPPPSAPKPRN